jgi:hypothetical protein
MFMGIYIQLETTITNRNYDEEVKSRVNLEMIALLQFRISHPSLIQLGTQQSYTQNISFPALSDYELKWGGPSF